MSNKFVTWWNKPLGQKNATRLKYGVAGFLLLIGLMLVVRISTASADTQPGPQNGQVVNLKDDGGGNRTSSGDVWKWCDGPNLVYQSRYGFSGGISVIPDSIECK